MDTMVIVRDLAKTYHRSDGTEVVAVEGIDLDIYKGEIFSLLGPNGAGKTTTISMISGLIPPTRGDAYIGGYSITEQPMAAKRLLGVIPQEIALYLRLTARQNLEFFGKMYGLGGKALAVRVDEMLDFIGLRERQHDRVETFSGGMKRRVNIAVGLLHRPQLVYMDEPTVGIDPQSRRRILDTVLRLRDEYHMTVLYTTHLMEEAEELSNRVGIIDHGEIIALGRVGDLTQQVGEEDRLIFHMGEQSISQHVLERIQQTVAGVTRVMYEPQMRDGMSDGAQSVEAVSTLTQLVAGVVTVFAKRGRRALPDILRLFNEAELEVLSVEVREPDLEAVFLQLTGRALRD